MEKVDLKRKIIRVSLIIILVFSTLFCIYKLKNSTINNDSASNMQFEGNTPMNSFVNINDQDRSKQNESSESQNNNIKKSNENNDNQQNSNKDMHKNDKNHRDGPQGKSGSNNSQYLPGMSIYSIIFLILSCIIYYLIKRQKNNKNILDEKLIIFTILFLGFIFRIILAISIQGHNDINLFKSWASTAANGLANFYSDARQADYPPLYIYLLAIIGKLATIKVLNSYFILMLKIPSILADMITGYLIYKLGKKHFPNYISIFLAIFYIFNPAIFIDSAIWGQVDSFFTLLIILEIYLLSKEKYVKSSIIFTLSVLMKPQGIIFLPIIFFELVRGKKLKNFIYAIISAMITVLIVVIPFSLKQNNPLWIYKLYLSTISEYPYASVNGFNFFALLGANYKPDTDKLFIINYHSLGMIFIVLITLISWGIYIKGRNTKYLPVLGLIQIAGVFTFSVGMHERYLFPAVALSILACIYLKDIRMFIVGIGFSITSYINISAVFFQGNSSMFNIYLKITAILNIILFVYLLKIVLQNLNGKIQFKIAQEELNLNES